MSDGEYGGLSEGAINSLNVALARRWREPRADGAHFVLPEQRSVL